MVYARISSWTGQPEWDEGTVMLSAAEIAEIEQRCGHTIERLYRAYPSQADFERARAEWESGLCEETRQSRRRAAEYAVGQYEEAQRHEAARERAWAAWEERREPGCTCRPVWNTSSWSLELGDFQQRDCALHSGR